MPAQFPTSRPRRLRHTQTIRNMVQETQVELKNLIAPIFVKHGKDLKNPIASMPGQYQISLDNLASEVNELQSLGIQSVLLFGIPEHKDPTGSDALNKTGIIAQATQLVKEVCPQMQVITDTCFCEYTNHGHCGLIEDTGKQKDVHNDKTLGLLAQQAIVQAQAGADIIAPSGMMDGQVTAIRHALDDTGFSHIPIMSYAVKYASNLYGPFREAAEGAPSFGDRKTYQMDPANTNEALLEAELDITEGADIIMVKPAGMYLDVIQRLKQTIRCPIAAYQVSGEYSMIHAASQQGWLDLNKMMEESLLSIKRAGASIIISYFAKDYAKHLQNQ